MPFYVLTCKTSCMFIDKKTSYAASGGAGGNVGEKEINENALQFRKMSFDKYLYK